MCGLVRLILGFVVWRILCLAFVVALKVWCFCLGLCFVCIIVSMDGWRTGYCF